MILSPRQYEAARLIAAGITVAETARRMGVTTSAASMHLRRATRRLGVSGRRALAAALLDCTPGIRPRPSRSGLVRGQPVRIVGGRYAGREATYLKLANKHQVLVAIGAGEINVSAKFVEARP